MNLAKDTPQGPPEQVDRGGLATDRILDGARECFLASGIAATTMQQIAERVGISRTWLYRNFESRDAIVRALHRRETRRFLSGLTESLGHERDTDQLIGNMAVYAVRFLRGNELLNRLIESEPNVILPFLTIEASPLLTMAAEWLEALLRENTAMSDSECRFKAELLVRLAPSVVLTPHVILDLDDDDVIRQLVLELVRIPAKT